MMLLISSMLAMAMAGRVNQHAFEEGKVKCGCNNKVGILAPKEKLEGIDVAPDAECAKPGVHASETPGRFCSCDEGTAKNWDVALGAAQKRLDNALQPKLEALKTVMEELQAQAHIAMVQEKLGIEIDASSIGKVKPKVTSFPRKEGEGLWVCCCQSQAAGKCKKDAEMENGWIKRGVHHKAPDRACEDETASEVAEIDQETPEVKVEEPETPEVENEGPKEEELSDQEDTEEELSDNEDTGSEAIVPEAPPVPAPVPTPPVPTPQVPVSPPSPPSPPSDSRAAFLRQIQAGKKLKKTKPSAPSPAPPAPSNPRAQLMNAIQGGVQLKPAKERQLPEKVTETTPREDLMSQIKAGIELKPPKERKPEVEVNSPPSLLDSIKNSPQFQTLNKHMNSHDEEEEDDADWD